MDAARPVKSAVLLIVFNRPDLTRVVFERIREVKPKTLLIVADGPREGVPGEADRCAKVREIVADVDWDCKVLQNYSDVNLGCRDRVSSGITWAFQNEPEVIVIEDDCVPSRSFFYYCDELLEKYRDDPKVKIIGADCRHSIENYSYSYYFGRTPYIWAWASWRRAWNEYDVEMKDWPEFNRQDKMTKMGWKSFVVNFYKRIWTRIYNMEIDTWDYQWVFAIVKNEGACIHPQVNLVKNIGFGQEATHTKVESRLANREAVEIDFPLRHPPAVELSWDVDHHLQRLYQAWWPRIVNRVKGIFKCAFPSHE